VQLGVSQGDGATLRTHLERLRASTGRVDARLRDAAQPLPAAVAPLWDVFVALSATRSAEAGIACTEIEAWQRLHGVRLSPWEVETIMAMDRTALDAAAVARQNKTQERNA